MIERAAVDDVPVLWASAPTPGPLHATLTFGCGNRDEDLDTIGISHLVAALAMPPSPPPAGQCYLIGAHGETWFSVRGQPREVAGQLAAVCRAFADLPVDRLAEVAARLDPADRSDPETVEVLLGRRFGPRGLGLARWPARDFADFTVQDVHRYAAQYFVTGNAVLLLTGPPPDGLRLPLPAGPRPPHPAPATVSAPGPRWCADLVSEVAVAFSVGHGGAVEPVQTMLADRLDAATRRHRLPHACIPDLIGVDETRQEAVLSLLPRRMRDLRYPRPAKSARLAELVWGELRRFATEGPTPAELTAAVDLASAALTNPEYVEAALERAGREILFDTAYDPSDELAELARLTPESAAASVRRWLSTALIVVPRGTEVDLPGVARDRCAHSPVIPLGRQFRRLPTARLVSARARRERLILSPDGVGLVDEDGQAHTILFTDVVMVEQQGAGRVVHGRDGCVIDVDPDRYRGARQVVRAVDVTVPDRRRHRLL